MKAKPFKATPVPTIVGMGPSDTMTRAEVVALIAHRVRDGRDDDRTARTRVSTNVFDAVKAGKLREESPGVFRLGDVSVWARATWPQHPFVDMPPIIGNASLALPAFRLAGSGYAHAATSEVAIAEILALRKENHALAEALAVAEGRVCELEPDAYKWRNWIDKKKGTKGD